MVVSLFLVTGALALFSNPRHRLFYLGEVAASAGSAGRSGGRSLRDSVPGPASLANSPSASPAPAAAPVSATTTPATTAPAGRPPVPPSRPTGAMAEGVSLPTADASGRVRVPMSDKPPAGLPAGGTPTGWELKEFAGEGSVELVRADGNLALRLRSDKASFALHRDVIVDLHKQPILTWSWKVARLPWAGDVRDPHRDDQAAQVYVIFPRWPSPRTSSDIIGYIWDSRAPIGTTLVHPRASNVRIVVVESGGARLGTWVREERNVAEDFKALFGREPSRVGKVALMIDSNDTRTDAEALFGELTFAPASTSAHTETPTTMLR